MQIFTDTGLSWNISCQIIFIEFWDKWRERSIILCLCQTPDKYKMINEGNMFWWGTTRCHQWTAIKWPILSRNIGFWASGLVCRRDFKCSLGKGRKAASRKEYLISTENMSRKWSTDLWLVRSSLRFMCWPPFPLWS